MDLKFESLDGAIYRAKIPGGWIIREFMYGSINMMGDSDEIAVSLAFVPDPNHEWAEEAQALINIESKE